MLEIHKARTKPYRPSANDQHERFNRTPMDAVRFYIHDLQDQWDVHLPQTAGVLRSADNRSIGFKANKLMLGRDVNTPAYLMFPRRDGTLGSADQYVAIVMHNIVTAHDKARDISHLH